jgi:xyloglucan-specific endo-beta-1,4-glucanase
VLSNFQDYLLAVEQLQFSSYHIHSLSFFKMHFQHSNFLALAALSSIGPVLALPTFSQLVPRAQASINLCGDYDYIILQNSPWIVYNMLYNAAKMVGTQCTYYDKMTTSSSGTQEVLWNSETDIEYIEST